MMRLTVVALALVVVAIVLVTARGNGHRYKTFDQRGAQQLLQRH